MKKKIKDNISNKELKKLSYSEIVAGRPFAETLEILIYIAVVLFGIYIGIKIFTDELYKSQYMFWIINYILIALITLLVLKNSFRTIWAMPTLRINMFLWISLIFIFYAELSPWHFYYIIPVTAILVFQISHSIDKIFIKKNKLDLSLLTREVLAKQQGFYIYLISYLLFLVIVYFVSNNFSL